MTGQSFDFGGGTRRGTDGPSEPPSDDHGSVSRGAQLYRDRHPQRTTARGDESTDDTTTATERALIRRARAGDIDATTEAERRGITW